MNLNASRLTQAESSKIYSSSAYNSIYDDFIKLLRKSRNTKITNKELFKLEMDIANRIIKIEKNISYFKNKIDRVSQNKEWFSREVYKAQRLAYKQIMDGIAWRYLNFDRASLRQVAEHNQTGYLTSGFINEASKAEYITNNSDAFVILNDLTNFLRYGDLTIVSPDKIFIDEAKTKGKSKGEQKKHLDELLNKLNQKKFSIGNSTADFLLVPNYPHNFLSEVNKVLIEAKNDLGTASSRLSPYLWVSCIYTEKIIKEYKDFTNSKPYLPKCPFEVETESGFIPLSNLFMFSEFSPNLAPYTIFPFDEELIADLVFGKCILTSHISQKKLKSSIEGKGWKVEFPTRDKLLDRYDLVENSDDVKKIVWDKEYHLHFRKGNFTTALPREVIFRLNTEFLSIKAIIDSLEHAKLNYQSLKEKYFVSGHKLENEMWV